MPVVGAWDFFDSLEQERFCYLSGMFGKGKTTLAFMVAYELYKKGKIKHVVSNIDSCWSEDLETVLPDPDGMLDTAIILDEAGLFLNYITQVRTLLQFCRKVNIYFILPTKSKPHRELQTTKVWVYWDMRHVGVNLMLIRWKQKDEDGDYKGLFGWVNPCEIYGIANTKDKPVDDGGISEWLQKVIKVKKTKSSFTFDGFGTEDNSGLGSKLQEFESALDSSLGDFEDQNDRLQAISKSLRRKKKPF
jgi:hypothetical protein